MQIDIDVAAPGARVYSASWVYIAARILLKVCHLAFGTAGNDVDAEVNVAVV